VVLVALAGPASGAARDRSIVDGTPDRSRTAARCADELDPLARP
jgi:hypothetical protein